MKNDMGRTLYLLRAYFERYCAEHNVEPDTDRCDQLMMTMYEESNDVIWDADFDSFYDFMVRNMI